MTLVAVRVGALSKPGAADARRHAHDQPVRRFQRRAIGAHVLHAGFGIARDDVGRGQGRRAVETRCRHRYRQQVESVTFPLQRRALDHYVVAFRLGDNFRLHRMRERVVPLRLDFLDGHTHADAVDRAVRGNRADHHGHRVFAAMRVDDIGKQKRLALSLLNAADKLPAHECMKLRILVDRLVYRQQQALRLQGFQMGVQVRIAARRRCHIGFRPLKRVR